MKPARCAHEAGVAGTTVPAFVERWTGGGEACVAGTTRQSGSCAKLVSPGLRSRPSLSGTTADARPDDARTQLVSPGLRSRPSLSGRGHDSGSTTHVKLVSPGLRSRPSLSVGKESRACLLGVAGTTVPAFVERTIAAGAVVCLRSTDGGVAGTTVPAFVERK